MSLNLIRCCVRNFGNTGSNDPDTLRISPALQAFFAPMVYLALILSPCISDAYDGAGFLIPIVFDKKPKC